MSHIHIDIDKLYFAYEKNEPIINDLSVHFREGESIGIIGANGVGKSTLLKLLVGLEDGFEGSIRIEEIPVEKNTLSKIRERVGYVFQDSESQLFTSSVYEDVAFAPKNYGFSKDEVQKRTEKALEMVHIQHLADKKIYKLSGGEKKLVAIATILSMTPDIILMDEPTNSLDPQNRRKIINLLNGFNHMKIIASHDLDFIWDTCSRTILMNDGRIVCDGNTSDVLSNKELLEANGLELPLSISGRNI